MAGVSKVLAMVSSLATFAKLLLVLVQALPTLCRSDIVLDTGNDTANQEDGWQERVAMVEAALRSMEATVNRLLDESANLTASLNLDDGMVSQHRHLQDTSKQLSTLEASMPEDAGIGSYCSGGSKKAAVGSTECLYPFTVVMGRCVFVESSYVGVWEHMRQFCIHMGADMVVIDSADFLWYLIRHLKENKQDNGDYWVGAHRVSRGAIFRWVDGTPVKTGTPFWGYENDYKNQQPYGDRGLLTVCMWKAGLYFLHSCSNSQKRSVICQKK